MNLYSYAGNNPIAFTDSFGLCPIPPSSCLGRQGADLAVGFTPVLSSIQDGATALTGKNYVTGEKVGAGGRLIALAGLLTPASGGEIRGAGKIITRGFGNIGGGVAKVEEALRGAVKWLGDGYREIKQGVFRSADDARQFRMTVSDLTDAKQGAHVHFESIGPDGRDIVENSHVRSSPSVRCPPASLLE